MSRVYFEAKTAEISKTCDIMRLTMANTIENGQQENLVSQRISDNRKRPMHDQVLDPDQRQEVTKLRRQAVRYDKAGNRAGSYETHTRLWFYDEAEDANAARAFKDALERGIASKKSTTSVAQLNSQVSALAERTKQLISSSQSQTDIRTVEQGRETQPEPIDRTRREFLRFLRGGVEAAAGVALFKFSGARFSETVDKHNDRIEEAEAAALAEQEIPTSGNKPYAAIEHLANQNPVTFEQSRIIKSTDSFWRRRIANIRALEKREGTSTLRETVKFGAELIGVGAGGGGTIVGGVDMGIATAKLLKSESGNTAQNEPTQTPSQPTVVYSPAKA